MFFHLRFILLTHTHKHTHTPSPKEQFERSFVAFKPGVLQRGLAGEFLQIFEQKGFKIVALKVIHPTRERAAEHYADLAGRPFFPGLVDFFSSSPIVCLCIEGLDAVATTRKMLGATQIAQAQPGTFRGDYAVHTGRNLMHASDSNESAATEIGTFSLCLLGLVDVEWDWSGLI